VTSSPDEALLLTPLYDVLFGDRSQPSQQHVTIDILAPPYPAAGTGALRVVRAMSSESALHLVAAYEGYEKL
jgi:hypothetical protein